MNQQHKDTIINMVAEIGLADTLTIFGGDKDIIRKAYIDNPQSYMNYLIGKINPIKNWYTESTRWCYQYKKNILHYEDNSNEIYIDDFIWNFFYKSVMQFDETKIESIISEWLYNHYPKLSSRKPKPYTDWDALRMVIGE